MLEQVVVFTRGGLVLWKYQFGKVDGSPVNDFIRNILIEVRRRLERQPTPWRHSPRAAAVEALLTLQERSILRHYLHDNYVVKWTLDNALGLVYVVRAASP